MNIDLCNWEKLGIIPFPKGGPKWMSSHCYIPTPILLNEKVIRIFAAFWDKDSVGRIGFIDVSALNPLEVIDFSEEPCLDIGDSGSFDDKGVSPLSMVHKNDTLYLFYVGWQRVEGVRYLLFTGLATSKNGGKSFTRTKKTPILDRIDSELLVRAGAGVIYDEESNLWKMIYAAGSDTININQKIVPTYSYHYLETKDPHDWSSKPKLAISPNVAAKEFGFGRPYILKDKKGYKMLYCIRSLDRLYSLGYAESLDMIVWERKDELLSDFNEKLFEFDREMRFAPWVLSTKKDTFLFYNGNDYGRSGISVAKNLST